MKKDELKWMLLELNENIAVIRGYAQLALECDHNKWAARYLALILKQTDKITCLTNIVTDLYINDKGSDCEGDSSGKDIPAGMEHLFTKTSNIKLH